MEIKKRDIVALCAICFLLFLTSEVSFHLPFMATLRLFYDLLGPFYALLFLLTS